MTTEERIDRLEKRIENVESKINSQDKAQLASNYELKELIRNAVSQGNEKILSVLKTHEDRLNKLENQDGEKAKAIIKAIVATSLSWLIMGILTNLPVIFK